MHLLFQSAPASGYTPKGKCVHMKKKLKPDEEQDNAISVEDPTRNPLEATELGED